jgi:hypothetical protein
MQSPLRPRTAPTLSSLRPARRVAPPLGGSRPSPVILPRSPPVTMGWWRWDGWRARDCIVILDSISTIVPLRRIRTPMVTSPAFGDPGARSRGRPIAICPDGVSVFHPIALIPWTGSLAVTRRAAVRHSARAGPSIPGGTRLMTPQVPRPPGATDARPATPRP